MKPTFPASPYPARVTDVDLLGPAPESAPGFGFKKTRLISEGYHFKKNSLSFKRFPFNNFTRCLKIRFR
jgi:hypothetical protein